MTNKDVSSGKYRYKAYGLNFSSDFQLEELPPSDGAAVIEVIRGKIPPSIFVPPGRQDYIKVDTGGIAFQIPGTAKYYIPDGNRIIIEPIEGYDLTVLKLYLMGSSFGALLFQRNILPIHGSAVVVDKKCIIITGLSGAGKSTLTNTLLKKGYPFLTDDVAAVTIGADGLPYVHPSYPQQKLAKNTLENTGEKISTYKKLKNGIDKFMVPVAGEFLKNPARLHAVIELCPDNSGKMEIERMKGSHKLMTIVKNTYRLYFIDYLGIEKEHFAKCSTIAKHVSVYKLTRPIGVFTTEEQFHLIVNELDLL